MNPTKARITRELNAFESATYDNGRKNGIAAACSALLNILSDPLVRTKDTIGEAMADAANLSSNSNILDVVEFHLKIVKGEK